MCETSKFLSHGLHDYADTRICSDDAYLGNYLVYKAWNGTLQQYERMLYNSNTWTNMISLYFMKIYLWKYFMLIYLSGQSLKKDQFLPILSRFGCPHIDLRSPWYWSGLKRLEYITQLFKAQAKQFFLPYSVLIVKHFVNPSHFLRYLIQTASNSLLKLNERLKVLSSQFNLLVKELLRPSTFGYH